MYLFDLEFKQVHNNTLNFSQQKCSSQYKIKYFIFYNIIHMLKSIGVYHIKRVF